jgi:hypothetical protein
MREKILFVRLPVLLLLFFFLGKLVMSLVGAPYEMGIRVFAMVPLQIHLALVWGAFGRRYLRTGIFGSIAIGVLIGIASQILIVFGTALSYPLGGTHFNEPAALGTSDPIGFMEAMVNRAGGAGANSIVSGIAAAIGWALAVLIPERNGSRA